MICGKQEILGIRRYYSYLVIWFSYGAVNIDCNCKLLAVSLWEIILCRSQLSSTNIFLNSLCNYSINASHTLLLSLRYQITLFIRCRRSGNPSQQYNVPLVRQSDNGIKVDSTSILGNNGQLVRPADWSSNITTDINVITILNTKRTHQLKEGAGIRDSLPGIINKFG